MAWRNNTFSLHVHVGVRDIDRAVRACDRLRPVLPLLLAVSANSPYLDGRDSGLHSARTQAFTKSFPRCGIPDVFGGWDAYREYIEFLVRTNSIVEFTQIWWSIRPHFAFGTVELRICDAQATASESEALAALMVACIAQAVRDEDEGVPLHAPPPRLVEENLWRAIRYGMDGRLIDLERAEEYPARSAIERLAAWTEPVRSELGIPLSFPELNGAQRQHRMIAAGASREEVFAASVQETRQSYTEVVRGLSTPEDFAGAPGAGRAQRGGAEGRLRGGTEPHHDDRHDRPGGDLAAEPRRPQAGACGEGAPRARAARTSSRSAMRSTPPER